ncbi:MAG: DNA gyrase subunit A [Thermoanaerobaculia bacterium]|nr:DNA gyrase subunit A [Thermoanaerobaculia bacterium]
MSDDTNQELPPAHQILPVDIEEEMKTSYLDYAMSVIIGRALPDVRDGLKPVHRRVLYGMWESGNRAGRAYKKSARIVGDVMGKYHPHGDTAIYDTVVRLAQPFSMRYPLVDGQGNFGSIDGDNPAAMRYTEVRLTRLSEELLREDIDKETVEWVENYDATESEPAVLPARLPNLLVNGSAGIAVGMATNIPPHNLAEVINGVVAMIENPAITLRELIDVIPGPDFPTAGFIHGMRGIHEAYASGRGTIQVRARAEVEEWTHDRQRIIVHELPYQVNKARLIERMAELVREKRVEGISDIRDESDRRGIRVVIELKRGEVGEIILNTLYKMTQLQTSFGMNMLAIVDNRPQVLTLPQILGHFLDHRRTVVIRRVRFDLKKAEHRAHILEGLLKALDVIDEIIATIRASQTVDEARSALMERFAFSEIQAQAILDMRLQRLTGLEREKLLEEYREVMELIERLRAILGSDELLLEVIRDELLEIKRLYGDERRTEIIHDTHDITIEDMIADEDMVITVTASGYIKRSPLTLYREQHRGGKGRKGMETKDDDFVEHLYVASAHSYVLVFTESGRVHWIKVHQIPEAGPASKGRPIVRLLELDRDEKLATTLAVREFGDGYIVFATENGTVKRTELAAYSNPRAGGIIAINIDDDDHLLDVRVTDGESDIFLATRNGYSIRFPEEDETFESSTLVGVRPMGRATRGVRGIKLRHGDRVVGMAALENGADAEGDILTISENGYGKRTEVAEYRRQSRGGMGIINLKASTKTGTVAGVRHVDEGDGLMLITHGGKLIRTSTEGVSRIGRATQGVKVMDLGASEDRVVALAKIVEREEDDEAAGEGAAAAADEPESAASEEPPVQDSGSDDAESEETVH